MQREWFNEYKAGFPASINGLRTSGLEKEFPIVDAKNFTALDVRPILQILADHYGAVPAYDDFYTDVLQAVTMPDGTVITNDSGWSNLEIALPPFAKLVDAEVAFDDIIALLKRLTGEMGGIILGYGIQPITPPAKENWIKKRRHEVVCQNFGCEHDVNITVISSSQVHVAVSQEEVALANNVFNWLAGVMIAMMANSPIWKGSIDPVRLAVRERMWWFTPDDRHGIFPGPSQDLDQLFGEIINFRHLVAKNGHDYFLPRNTFAGFLRENQDREFQKELPALEGTMWFCSRPRATLGTVEIRPACTQPREASMALPAFSLGIAENLSEAQDLIDDFGYPWGICRELRETAMTDGLKGKVDDLVLADLAGMFLEISKRGLKKRNLGEEEYLTPLWNRVQTRETLAEEIITIFEKGGISALIERVAF